MARTILTKRLTQIRDIDYVRALLKTAAVMSPNSGLSLPNQLPGLPKPPGLTPGSPTAGNPYRASPPAPALAPAKAPFRAPDSTPAPMGQPPALSRQSPVTPDALNPQSLQVNPGAPTAFPPPPAVAPINPQPQPTNLPPRSPASAIAPQMQPLPTVTQPAESVAQPKPPAPAVAPKQTGSSLTSGEDPFDDAKTPTKPWTPPEDMTPDQEEAVNTAQATAANAPEEVRSATAAALSNPNDPKAGAIVDGAARQNLEKEVAGDPAALASGPEGFGSRMGQAMEWYGNQDPMVKGLLALGLTTGAIGMISGMSGGGIGSFLMTLLGLGGAGAVGALSGAFGEEPAKLVEGMLGSAAQGLGVKTPSADEFRKQLTDAGQPKPGDKPGDAQARVVAKTQELRTEAKKWNMFPTARQFNKDTADPYAFSYGGARDAAVKTMQKK